MPTHSSSSRRRPGDYALVFLCLTGLLFGLAVVQALMTDEGQWIANRRLVAQLGVTDLCLVTEARYTRHLSQADMHTPFQDHPLALEHFPSGSIFVPPAHLRAADAHRP